MCLRGVLMTAFSAKRLSVGARARRAAREAPAIAPSPAAGAASLGDEPDAVTSKQKSPRRCVDRCNLCSLQISSSPPEIILDLQA